LGKKHAVCKEAVECDFVIKKLLTFCVFNNITKVVEIDRLGLQFSKWRRFVTYAIQ